MKKTLLSIFLTAGAFLMQSQAQTVIFDSGFNAMEDGAGFFSFDLDGDGYTWGLNPEGAQNQEEFEIDGGWMFSMSYLELQGVPYILTPDNLLITPAFQLNDYPGTQQAIFTLAGLDPGYYAEHYSIYVVRDSEISPILDGIFNEEIAPETILDHIGTPVSEQTLASTYAFDDVIDVSNFAGDSVRFLIRHHESSNEYVLIFDRLQVISGVMSTDEAVSKSFRIYPNPAQSELNIASTDALELQNITIRDLNGRLVKSQNATGIHSKIQVNDLASGMYTVEVETAQGKGVQKFVKK